MSRMSWNRRQFLLASTATASASILGDSLFHPPGVSAATFTRMDVGNLTASSSQILSYAKAVTAMKALPSSDPRSWTYQAAIHGTQTPCPCPTSWNTCEHGTEFFWSWHRMYLYYFEKIVRRMSGDYGWALPYWNWQLASERTLPAMFQNTSSSLYTSNRNANINNGTASLSNGTVDCSVALSDTDYTSAVLDIQGPHGNVHVSVGGWMGGVPTSAQDPIFYLHHANVDRLWNIWLAQGGGRTDPLTDAAWRSKTYTFFDENGHAVTMTDCDVLRAALQLNYTYQGEPAQVNEYCLRRIVIPPWLLQLVVLLRLPIPELQVNSDPVTLPIELSDKLAQIEKLAASPEKLLIVLEGVQAATQPGVTYDVYIGLPPEPRPTRTASIAWARSRSLAWVFEMSRLMVACPQHSASPSIAPSQPLCVRNAISHSPSFRAVLSSMANPPAYRQKQLCTSAPSPSPKGRRAVSPSATERHASVALRPDRAGNRSPKEGLARNQLAWNVCSLVAYHCVADIPRGYAHIFFA